METLYFKRALLNPIRYPLFAWKLFSHKVCRWLFPWTGALGLIGLLMLATRYPQLTILAAIAIAAVGVSVIAWIVSDRLRLPSVLQLAAFSLFANLAVLHASIRALHGDQDATWEPTRRESVK
jgi:hypothetical protein